MRINRRRLLQKVLGVATSGFAMNLLLPVVIAAQGENFAADRKTIGNWMDDWMEATKAPQGALIVGRFANPIYFLYKPITWQPNKGQEQFPTVTVPIGFVTDFASIPQIFWSILKPDGLYAYAAVVHDYLYWTQSTPREVADNVLRLAMEDFHVGAMTIKEIYQAVVWFGGQTWEENKTLKANGEKRILRQFPDDPRITWEEYKKEDVFQK